MLSPAKVQLLLTECVG